MVYDMIIYIVCSVVTGSQNDAENNPFFMFCCNIGKNTNFHKVITNIYKHHLINYKYHNNSMFRYLLNAFYLLQFGKKLRSFTQNIMNGLLRYRLMFCPIAYIECLLDVQK